MTLNLTNRISNQTIDGLRDKTMKRFSILNTRLARVFFLTETQFICSLLHMLALKLSRVGKKGKPTYKLIAIDKRKDTHNRAVDFLGHYDPRDVKNKLVVDAEKIKTWIAKGAQPTDTVHNLLIINGIITGDKKKNTKITLKRKAKIAAASK